MAIGVGDRLAESMWVVNVTGALKQDSRRAQTET